MDRFASHLLRWYAANGRHDLPWQHPRTPYRVWVSEVMLQQTRVRTVIPYFKRFVAALPDVAALAAASVDEVLALWAGLGYYRRALQLRAAAMACVQRHGRELPRSYDELVALPGIGRSTAAAIMALAHGERFAILDGNVKRVLARVHGIHGWPGTVAIETELWNRAEAHLPASRLADYTQAIMDLGATTCTRAHPDCGHCPLAGLCVAHRDGLTAELPTRRPRRAVPERQRAFVVLRDRRGRVLLQRRPATGVWPGLWSLPEAPDAAAAQRLAARFARLDDAVCSRLPTVHHGFTHFKLTATPLLWAGVTALDAIADDPGLRWQSVPDLARAGTPAPVMRLLRALAQKQPERDPAIPDNPIRQSTRHPHHGTARAASGLPAPLRTANDAVAASGPDPPHV